MYVCIDDGLLGFMGVFVPLCSWVVCDGCEDLWIVDVVESVLWRGDVAGTYLYLFQSIYILCTE